MGPNCKLGYENSKFQKTRRKNSHPPLRTTHKKEAEGASRTRVVELERIKKSTVPPFRWLIGRRSQGGRSFSVGLLPLLPARFTFLDLPEVVRQISTSPGAPKAAIANATPWQAQPP